MEYRTRLSFPDEDFDGKNCLQMTIDFAHRDKLEDEEGIDGDIDTDNLVTVEIPNADLAAYRKFLLTVADMIKQKMQLGPTI